LKKEEETLEIERETVSGILRVKEDKLTDQVKVSGFERAQY
jgi:hypothetical protein